MSSSVLQTFLDNQFIATNDLSHVESLGKASAILQRTLRQKKNRPKIAQYTLVALDPNVSIENPIVEEVESLIVKQWPTFRNSVVKTKDAPVAYTQAVILDSLDKLSNDTAFAPIVWHTGCNIIGHYRLAGQKKVLSAFLLEIGNRVEVAARQNWSISDTAKIEKIDPMKTKKPKVTAGSVSEEDLRAHLLAAAGQQSIGGENPQWPGHNAAIWPTFFSKRAASGLSEEFNNALSAQFGSIESIAKFLESSVGTYLEEVKPFLDSVTDALLQNSESIAKRSQVLWWKQALYSERLDVGYRSMDPLSMSISMAVDLATLVSPIYPRSVDYLLLETSRDVIGDKIDKKLPLSEFLEPLRHLPNGHKELLEGLADSSEHRRAFGACFLDFSDGKMDIDEFCTHVGIDKNTELSYGELLSWLFHDLHASSLSAAK